MEWIGIGLEGVTVTITVIYVSCLVYQWRWKHMLYLFGEKLIRLREKKLSKETERDEGWGPQPWVTKWEKGSKDMDYQRL